MVRDYYYCVILWVLDEIIIRRTLCSAVENANANWQIAFLKF